MRNWMTTSIAAINATLNEVVANTKQASIENAESMIHGVAATARVHAAVGAADPAFFRTEQSRQSGQLGARGTHR